MEVLPGPDWPTDFETRYGLKFEEPMVRFRLLDDQLVDEFGGFSDLNVPLSEFTQRPIPCERIFITENKVNGLSFPPKVKGMVIFGLGYGVSMLKAVEWMASKEILYWGDIDTHGFSILSRLRSFFPSTRSFLMDRMTLMKLQNLWVEEPADLGFTGELNHLTAPKPSSSPI